MSVKDSPYPQRKIDFVDFVINDTTCPTVNTNTLTVENLTVTGSTQINGAVQKTTNLAGGSAYQIPYQVSTDQTGFTSITSTLQPIISNGTSAPASDKINLATTPSTGILGVSNGGTNSTSLSTINVGSTTNKTGGNSGNILVQTAPNTTGFITPGVSGTALVSNGVGVLPSFKQAGASNTAPTIQSFTSSGTYTPPANVKYIKVLGVSKGGSGANSTVVSQVGNSGGTSASLVKYFAAEPYSVTFDGNGVLTFKSASDYKINIGGDGSPYLSNAATKPGTLGSTATSSVTGLVMFSTPSCSSSGRNFGNGASNMFGQGGRGVVDVRITDASGDNARGQGAGGTGAMGTTGVSGTGTAGKVWIIEYY